MIIGFALIVAGGKLTLETNRMTEKQESYNDFCNAVRGLLDKGAAEKGYSKGGADGENPVNDFMQVQFPGHSLGEVLYKCLRYQAMGNREDLEKAAAWLYLVWKR